MPMSGDCFTLINYLIVSGTEDLNGPCDIAMNVLTSDVMSGDNW